MRRKRCGHRSAAALLVLASALLPFACAAAEPTPGTLLVSTIGIDSQACGRSDNPCRSITRAIANAREGDNVLVEAGQYGDLNRDGDQSDRGGPRPDPADEAGPGRCDVSGTTLVQPYRSTRLQPR